MKKTVKIALISVISLLTIFISGLVFLNTQIDKEKVKKLVIENIENNLIDTKVVLSDLDYSLGASIKFKIQDFKLINSKTKNKLLLIQELGIDIPLFSILTGGGVLEINSKKPEVFVRKTRGSLNWMEVLPKPAATKEKDKKESTDVKVELPSFVSNSKVNIRFEDIILNYNEDGKKSVFNITKFLVKNLNLKSSTAYEIRSKISYAVAKDSTFSTKIKLIGDVNLKKFLKSGSLASSVKLILSDQKMDGKNLPEVKGEFKVDKDKEVINAKGSLAIGSLIDTNIKLKLDGDNLAINSLDTSLNLDEILKNDFVKSKVPKKLLETNKFNILISGSALLGLSTNTFVPNFDIKSQGDLKVKLHPELSTKVSLKGSVKKNDFDFKLINNIEGGIVTSQLRTRLNVMKLPTKLSAFNPININMDIEGLQLSKAKLQKIIYAGQKSKKEAPTTAVVNSNVDHSLELPPVNIFLKGKDISLNGSKINWDGKIKMHKNRVDISKFDYRQDNGKMGVTAAIKFTRPSMNIDFKNQLNKIDAKSFNALLPPYLKDIEGVFSGSNNGNIRITSKLTYDIKSVLNAKNGELKGLDLNKFFDGMFESDLIKKAIAAKKVVISNKFDSFAIKSRVTTSKLELKKFELIGSKRSSMLEAKGNISMQDKNSQLVGTLEVASIKEQLQKALDIKSVPFKLQGNGFVMLPVISYTTGKMIKKRTDKVVKKEKKKLKKKAKKELEKEAKKLLKGIKF